MFNIFTNIAQEINLIKIYPHSANGYLILKESSSIKYWHIEIIETDSAFTEEVIERNDLIGKNYLKISEEYLMNSNYYIKIIAYYNDGSEYEENYTLGDPYKPEQPGGPDWEHESEWHCNGVDYAWRIDQFCISNQGVSYLVLGHDVAGYNNTTGVVTPYYQYFSENNFIAFRNNIFSIGNNQIDGIYYADYYDIPPNWLDYDGLDVIKLLNNPNITYKDRYGVTINSTYVIGIHKGVGPWAPYANCWQTEDFLSGPGYDRPWAIDRMNLHADFQYCNKPQLECICAPTGNGNFDNFDSQHAAALLEVPTLDSIVWIWDILQDWDSILNGSNSINWWDNYYALSITSISGNNGEIANIKISDLIDENGNINDISVSLNSGLYTFGINYSDGAYESVVKEIIPSDSNNNDANSLSTLIYPNPLSGNEFNMNLDADKDLKFIYRLNDFNGNLIYESKFYLNKDETEIVTIKPELEIPYGYLINQFIFEDNSQFSIITVKN